LKFARSVIENRGAVSDADLQAVKSAGFSEGEIAEVIANVALNIFTNYFNETAKTEIDFSRVELPLKHSVDKA
jgi:alkylhydroperoxidase family enzyme